MLDEPFSAVGGFALIQTESLEGNGKKEHSFNVVPSPKTETPLPRMSVNLKSKTVLVVF